MKKLLSIAFCVMLLVVSKSYATSAAEYFVDDQAIESVLNAGDQIDLASATEATSQLSDLFNGASNNLPTKTLAEKSPAVAFVLAWVLGVLGIHRAYLGTAGGVIVGYILTCGGLGIVALIDWVVLLIEVIDEKKFDQYVDNKKFFMWSN